MKLSIITVNYNNAEGLFNTIESVRNQVCCDNEHIIIDGGSTDGSVEIINNYKGVSFCCSEPDDGPFDAMNKGIEKATGEYCIFMNSGDSFYNEHVVERFISKHPEKDIYTGITAEHVDGVIRDWHPPLEKNICLFWFYRHALSHQSSFIKTSLLKELRYDTEFHIVSDWLFFMIALLNRRATYEPLPFYVSHYMGGGISRNEQKAFAEREKALEKYYGTRILRDFHSMQYGMNEWENIAKKVDPNSIIGKLIVFLTKILLTLRK